MFSLYAEKAEKLSSLGSTQANESFNRIVASKAPKSQHYSSSGSLKYRIAASVAQKNVGNTFMLDVNRRMSLSPGYFTESLAKLRDHKHKKRKATSQTHQFKQKRRSLKSARQQKLATSEVREGATYASGINFEEQKTDNIEEIPAPVLQTAYDVVEWNTEVNEIFVDIEATVLARDSHITQISAKGEKDVFNTYVLPKKPVTPKAQEITGIKVEGNKMFCHDKEVKPVKIKKGLEDFMNFLSKNKKPIIIGHNIKVYDIPILFRALNNCDLMDKFSHAIIGFVDTLQLFKSLVPGLNSYSQSNLYQSLLKESYDGHNSLEDVVALGRLYFHLDPSTDAKQSSSFTFNSALNRYDHVQRTKKLLASLTPLTQRKVITLRTANLIASSGMSMAHFKLSFERDSRQGIEDILKEQDENGKVRVTKSKKIVDALFEYFKKLSPEV